MNPPTFDYYRAADRANALYLLNQHPGAKLIAGGHSLIPAMNLHLAHPEAVVDIGRLDDMKGIHVFPDGNVAIYALTTHAEIARSRHVPEGLSEAAGMIGDPQVRNRGTIGGNLAHADPASDLPTVVTALDCTLEIMALTYARMTPANGFFTGLFQTGLQEGEILATVVIPPQLPGTGSAYVKMANPASRYCMVGVAAVLGTDPAGNFSRASVAIGGLTPHARRAPSVEAALMGQPATAATCMAAAAAVDNDLGGEILGDIHASADYRRAMAPVYVKRALLTALERCGA
ncbi:MAG: xanthine dehydrogenase family protein subunit M [Chloroflexota bacterium]